MKTIGTYTPTTFIYADVDGPVWVSGAPKVNGDAIPSVFFATPSFAGGVYVTVLDAIN